MNSRSERAVRAIGGSIGDVMEVESDGIAWDKSARLKVRIDISKPLRRVQRIKAMGGEETMIEIKYERLPTFCYECGVIGHIERDCQVECDEDEVIEKQWGTWLRASPRRGQLKLHEEAKKFLRCNRKLHFDDKTNREGTQLGGGESGDKGGERRRTREKEDLVSRGQKAREGVMSKGMGKEMVPCRSEMPNPSLHLSVDDPDSSAPSLTGGIIGKETGGVIEDCLEMGKYEGIVEKEGKDQGGLVSERVVEEKGKLEEERMLSVLAKGNDINEMVQNLDTQMEERYEVGKQEGQKWTRVTREKGGVKLKVGNEKQEGKTKKSERDKVEVVYESMKKRAVDAAEIVVAGPTPWALGEQ